MARPLPTNELELRFYKEMSRINQGWVVLWVVLSMCVVFALAVLYATFWRKDFALAGVNGLLDGLFGWSLKRIVNFHYPQESTPKGLLNAVQETLAASSDEP